MSSLILFKIVGVFGLLLICIAMVVKKRSVRDIFSLLGGTGLLIYSIYLHDLIFIVLQSVYIMVVGFDMIKESRKNR